MPERCFRIRFDRLGNDRNPAPLDVVVPPGADVRQVVCAQVRQRAGQVLALPEQEWTVIVHLFRDGRHGYGVLPLTSRLLGLAGAFRFHETNPTNMTERTAMDVSTGTCIGCGTVAELLPDRRCTPCSLASVTITNPDQGTATQPRGWRVVFDHIGTDHGVPDLRLAPHTGTHLIEYLTDHIGDYAGEYLPGAHVTLALTNAGTATGTLNGGAAGTFVAYQEQPGGETR